MMITDVNNADSEIVYDTDEEGAILSGKETDVKMCRCDSC